MEVVKPAKNLEPLNHNVKDDFYVVPNLKFDVEKMRADLNNVLKKKKFSTLGIKNFGAIALNQVPGDKSSDMLNGAIIGGIIGNNVGNIENGGAAGAIIGGILGHNNSNATGGTQRQCRTETRYNESTRKVYSHSTIRFWYEGQKIELSFHK